MMLPPTYFEEILGDRLRDDVVVVVDNGRSHRFAESETAAAIERVQQEKQQPYYTSRSGKRISSRRKTKGCRWDSSSKAVEGPKDMAPTLKRRGDDAPIFLRDLRRIQKGSKSTSRNVPSSTSSTHGTKKKKRSQKKIKATMDAIRAIVENDAQEKKKPSSSRSHKIKKDARITAPVRRSSLSHKSKPGMQAPVAPSRRGSMTVEAVLSAASDPSIPVTRVTAVAKAASRTASPKKVSRASTPTRRPSLGYSMEQDASIPVTRATAVTKAASRAASPKKVTRASTPTRRPSLGYSMEQEYLSKSDPHMTLGNLLRRAGMGGGLTDSSSSLSIISQNNKSNTAHDEDRPTLTRYNSDVFVDYSNEKTNEENPLRITKSSRNEAFVLQHRRAGLTLSQ